MEPRKVMHLDERMVVDIYHRLIQESPTGLVSSAMVADRLAKDVLSATTGRPFTRQAILKLLKKSVRTSSPTSKQYLPPILCLNPEYPHISVWIAHNLEGESHGYWSCTVALVDGRDVYGLPPLAAMIAARNVYWLFYRDEPVFLDIYPDQYDPDFLALRAITCKPARSSSLSKS